jgi:glucan phosphoethanolaminetransferase (alkaline phosphatase superfamily)
MFRRLVDVTLLVSFVAMSTSGMMMFFIERPSFTLQMHPVHKIFGMLLTITVICHLSLNYRLLWQHLRKRAGVIALAVLTVLLVLLYTASFTKAVVPADLAQRMDSAAKEAEELLKKPKAP